MFSPNSPTYIARVIENDNTLFYLDSWSENIVALDIYTLEVKRKYNVVTSSSNYRINVDKNNLYFLSEPPIGFGSREEVVVNSEYGLQAIDINTGDLKWKFNSPTYANICGEIIVADDYVCFGSMDNHLNVLDANTGKKILRFKTDGTVCNPYIEEGVVYFGSYDGYLYAVDLKTGEKKWSFATKNKIVTKPVVYQSNIYVLSFDNFLYEIDIKSGKEKRRYNIVSGYVDPIVSSDGLIILVDKDGHIYALN